MLVICTQDITSEHPIITYCDVSCTERLHVLELVGHARTEFAEVSTAYLLHLLHLLAGAFKYTQHNWPFVQLHTEANRSGTV